MLVGVGGVPAAPRNPWTECSAAPSPGAEPQPAPAPSHLDTFLGKRDGVKLLGARRCCEEQQPKTGNWEAQN